MHIPLAHIPFAVHSSWSASTTLKKIRYKEINLNFHHLTALRIKFYKKNYCSHQVCELTYALLSIRWCVKSSRTRAHVTSGRVDATSTFAEVLLTFVDICRTKIVAKLKFRSGYSATERAFLELAFQQTSLHTLVHLHFFVCGIRASSHKWKLLECRCSDHHRKFQGVRRIRQPSSWWFC